MKAVVALEIEFLCDSDEEAEARALDLLERVNEPFVTDRRVVALTTIERP